MSEIKDTDWSPSNMSKSLVDASMTDSPHIVGTSQTRANVCALLTLMLGAISFVAWGLPVAGLLMALLGMGAGIVGSYSRSRRAEAAIGISLAIMGFILSLAFLVAGH